MSMPSPVWPLMLTVPMVSEPDMPLRLMPVGAATPEVTESSVALSVVGLINSAVPLFEMIWVVPDVDDVDRAGALGAEAEGVGAVDSDVDAAVEIVGAGVGAAALVPRSTPSPLAPPASLRIVTLPVKVALSE